MNDEIKEILDRIETASEIFDCLLKPEECTEILDYITNLQQENEYLKLNNPEMNIEHFRIINENKRKIDNLRKQNKELQQENERLNNCIDDQERVINSLIDKRDLYKINYNDYKSRCEKAIEYINVNKHLSMFADCREPEDWNYDLECSANDLLNILQNGGDKE